MHGRDAMKSLKGIGDSSSQHHTGSAWYQWLAQRFVVVV